MLHRKISVLLITMVGIIFFYSFLKNLIIEDIPLTTLIYNPDIITAAAVFIILLFSHLFLAEYGKAVQILFLLITSVFAVFSDYNSFYSHSSIILAYILMHKYGFLDKRIGLKTICLVLFHVITIEAALLFTDRRGAGIKAFLYAGFFLAALYIVCKSEILKNRDAEKRNSADIMAINREREILDRKIEKDRERLLELESLVKCRNRDFDLSDIDIYNLTKREKQIITELLRTGNSNKDIAERLKIQEGTVKAHLYKAYNKIGVDNRASLFRVFDGGPVDRKDNA